MPRAGIEREALLRAADRLCAEVGCRDGGVELQDGRSALLGNAGGGAWSLSPEDESLVTDLRQNLGRLAAGMAEAGTEGGERAVRVALDGAELAMRGELLSGNLGRLPALMPSFVFLVTLPVAEQDRALQLSRRASELIEGELAG